MMGDCNSTRSPSEFYKGDMSGDLTREDVKAYIQEVCEAGLLNENETNENLLADIKKYGLISA